MATSTIKKEVIRNIECKTAQVPTGGTGISVANATNTALGNFTVPASRFVLVVYVYWPSNASGYRNVWISTASETGARDNVSYESIVAPCSGNYTLQQLVVTGTINTEYTMYIVGKQNSGSTITGVYTRYSIVYLQS